MAAALVGLLVLAGGGIAIAGGGGTSAGPAVGGPLPAGIAARAVGPAGGLAWGVRVVRTTDWTCAQLGRLHGDALGVLGKDGSFGDDGRFHPFGPSTTNQAYCAQNDANGHAFLNIQLGSQPASGQGAGYRTAGKCHPAADVAQAKQALSSTGRSRALRIVDTWAVCPGGDLRFVQYGLLGPEATSITYILDGRSETERTHGPDGAYLVVGPSSPSACARFGPGGCAGSAPEYSAQISAGMITAVRYRDGQTCGLNRSHPREPALLVTCPLAGYAPAKSSISESQIAAPISVRLITAKHYCFTRNSYVGSSSRPALATDIGPYLPCDGAVPANEIRDPMNAQGTVVVFSWTAREPVTSASSQYQFSVRAPDGPGGGGGTFGTIRAGERLTRGMFLQSNLKGRFIGTVDYDPSVGPGGFNDTPMPRRGQNGSILVGRFTITIH